MPHTTAMGVLKPPAHEPQNMSKAKRNYARPLDIKNGAIDMSHGAGGRAMAQLIAELFMRHLGNGYLGQGNDGAVLPAPLLGE